MTFIWRRYTPDARPENTSRRTTGHRSRRFRSPGASARITSADAWHAELPPLLNHGTAISLKAITALAILAASGAPDAG
jgi:hypothetical protein